MPIKLAFAFALFVDGGDGVEAAAAAAAALTEVDGEANAGLETDDDADDTVLAAVPAAAPPGDGVDKAEVRREEVDVG
jgi:hypothetical protein